MAATGTNFADIPASRLLVAVCDFGWGSLGKLRLILDRLPDVEVSLFGDVGFGTIVSRLLGSRHVLRLDGHTGTEAALVINDPAAANRIASDGVPVIYVDSLPFLWTTEAEVPERQSVSCYCAQRFPLERMPLARPLRDWPNLRWVDPIVPSAKAHRGGKGIVVNVGGMHSHMGDASTDAYVSLVLIPLAFALQSAGRPVLAICGNLDDATCNRIRALMPQPVAIGPQTPYAFEMLLRDADLLITSPGSTTILQALAIRLPTLLLPPQNLSQILNARLYADPSVDVMQWPASVVDPNTVERLRPEGEEAVIGYIYGAVRAAAGSPDAAAKVSDIIQEGLRSAPHGGVLDKAVAGLGTNGASQVAQLVKQFLLAPVPRIARATPSKPP